MKLKFKEGFLLGSASAATQIEGGELDSNWMQFWREGGIKDGTSPAVADMHWERWKEDDDIIIAMGMKIARIGLEWCRICPDENAIDESAIARYREELQYLVSHGVKPLLTIHHFSNPMWFEKRGGWVRRENCRYYLELVKVAVEHFGDLVSEYITINEPNVYATNCFCFGEWYPQHKSFRETFAVMENMAYCHIEAYGLIHSMRREMGYCDTMVGFANHLRVFDPKDEKNPAHRAAASAAEYFFQGALSRAMSLGEFLLPLVNRWGIKKGEYSDFNGINYYSRSTISGLCDGVRENCPKNDLGWEIYPEGLVRCANKMTKLLNRPIWITENGTCDNSDSFRCRYLYEHLSAVTESPLPIQRYYHWCFTDNFEWAEGQSARFGLVHVDYDSQKRTMKRSGDFYHEMIENSGVTDEMYEKYVSNLEYNIR